MSAYIRRCAYWGPAGRCQQTATHYLFNDAHIEAGALCEKHARTVVTEYNTMLGWHWTMQAIAEVGNETGVDAAVARALALIRAKLAAESVSEDDDDAVRDCLSRTVMPVKLTAIWFAHKDGKR